jgi:flavodoxin
MKTTIYVFSATGNSLTTASILAEKINADLISIASVKKLGEINEDSDRIGFVFPVYYGNMPYPVRELITRMNFSSEAYVFSVATYRGHSGDVAKRMDR